MHGIDPAANASRAATRLIRDLQDPAVVISAAVASVPPGKAPGPPAGSAWTHGIDPAASAHRAATRHPADFRTLRS